jgi:hypothetical protein
MARTILAAKPRFLSVPAGGELAYFACHFSMEHMMKQLRHTAFITLLALLSACSMMAPPDRLDVRTTKPSAHGSYLVAIRPLVPQVGVNTIHAWEIRVTGADGTPVNDAAMTFDGGMPQHGHGFPTQPRVTEKSGDGRYRLDGVKFSMTGWWEMKLHIQSPAATDDVTFNTVLPRNPTVADSGAGTAR